ncbi:COX2 oxidase, partial [Pelecanoides urinatrix]|nr:COX2 oxidase [Emberiza fucata]NXT45238.1 COX2 oxidase [Pelecanoides urinatrix]NXW26078.1 COX2 oxidase [Circaetus pectoralis]
MANQSQINFQDASSPIIEELIKFHDHALIVVLAICTLVLYLLTLILTEKLTANTVDAQTIELV